MASNEKIESSSSSIRKSESSATQVAAAPAPPARPQLKKYSHRFFSPELKMQRKIYIKVMLMQVLITVFIQWSSLTVYWGSLAHQKSYSRNMHGWLVNLDGAEFGTAMEAAIQANIELPTHLKLGWSIYPTPQDVTLESITEDIINEKAWFAVVVNKNATSNLVNARANGDASYNPSSALTLVYNQGRNEQVANNYVIPYGETLLNAALNNISNVFAAQYLGEQAGNATALAMLQKAPQTIGSPFYYTLNNTRPYSAMVASAILLVGSIYVIIFGFIITQSGYAVRQLLEPWLTTPQLFMLRVFAPMIIYIPLSLSYSMVNLAFKLPFDAKYTYAGGFFTFFVYLFLGMTALGLSTEAVVTFLTPKLMPYFTLPLIIMNVSVASLPINLEPWFYKYGYAFPIYNLSQATRTLIFNTKSHLGLNAGVLIAWIVLNMITIPAGAWILRRQEQKAAAKAAAAGGAPGPAGPA